LITIALQNTLKSGSIILSILFSFFKNFFDYSGSIEFPYEFKLAHFFQKKKKHLEFDEGCIESLDHFGDVAILAMVSLPNHGHGVFSLI
jgi:hypothetical protein